MRKSHCVTLLTFLFFISCTKLVQNTDTKDYEQQITITPSNQASSLSKFSIIFTNNVNGETHPCGCRQFPLGGIPQVAGALHQFRQKAELIMVDTGDTFFPTTRLPDAIKNSLLFTAKKLAQAMEDLGVQYFLPGDQDFAAGIDFLAKISRQHKFNFLITNLSQNSPIKHLRYAKISLPDYQIYLVGLIGPSLYPSELAASIEDPALSLTQVINEIEQKDGNEWKKKNIRLIALTHGGVDFDKELAQKFPQLDWIIGSHSQSFLQIPLLENKTQIGQALYKNHYLGRISFDLINRNNPDEYQLHETHADLENVLKPNPFSSFLTKYKSELDKIQAEEQMAMMGPVSSSSQATGPALTPTFNSCLECHQKQGEFWQKTPHASAFITLMKKQANHNSTCIACHTLKFGEPGGVKTSERLVLSEGKPIPKAYWDNLGKIYAEIPSLRQESGIKLMKSHQAMMALDKKFKVSHNFQGVQCLNCHEQTSSHPFDFTPGQKQVSAAKIDSISTRCLNCHTYEQTPEWYKDRSTLNRDKLREKIKLVSCPKVK